MNRLFKIVAVAAVLGVMVFAIASCGQRGKEPTPQAEGEETYVVAKRGDTYESIAETHGLDAEELEEFNLGEKITKGTVVHFPNEAVPIGRSVGVVITPPAATVMPSECGPGAGIASGPNELATTSDGFVIMIEKITTPQELGKAYGVDPTAIIEVNYFNNVDCIQPGAMIFIPKETP